MPKSWPSSPLKAAKRAFDLLTCPPTQLAFDGRGFNHLPQRILPLDELTTVLISDKTPRRVRDQVWRELVTRANRDGPGWVVAAVGIAMPGLRATAGFLAARWRGDTVDLDAELLAGFVERLHTIDLDEPRVCGRLIDAGVRAAKRSRDAQEETEAIRVDSAWSKAPQQPWDHPDWVLARAVAAAVIAPDECLLIGATRLEDIPLQVVADKLEVSTAVAAAWRRAAERRVASAIATGELDWVPIATRPARTGRTTGRSATSASGGRARPVPGIDSVNAGDHTASPAA